MAETQTQSNSQLPDKTKKSKVKAQSREFRDALTRATGALRGATTNAKQWDRWTP